MILLGWLWQIFIELENWLKKWVAFCLGIDAAPFRRHRPHTKRKSSYRHPPKPAWVRREIIRLKALMPDAGCRMIAATFNRRFAASHSMTVGKSFVNSVIRKHDYEIQVQRAKIKNARPKPLPKNLIWGMDITGKVHRHGKLHSIPGAIEYQGRACLCIKAIAVKSSWQLIRSLKEAINRHGKPKIIRTDNEPVFTSRLFRITLLLWGIRHQRIEKGCPWQNGHMERLFGTLKATLDCLEVDTFKELNVVLAQFRFWYNHVRPHQNLKEQTPAEVWSEIDFPRVKLKREYWFEAWDGLLTGIYQEH